MFSTTKNFFQLLNLVNAYDASLYFGLFWETFIKFETSAGSLTNLKMSGVRKYQHKHKCKKNEKSVWPGCCATGESVQLCPLWGYTLN